MNAEQRADRRAADYATILDFVHGGYRLPTDSRDFWTSQLAGVLGLSQSKARSRLVALEKAGLMYSLTQRIKQPSGFKPAMTLWTPVALNLIGGRQHRAALAAAEASA